MAYLETMQGQRPRRYELGDEPTVIGRSRECGLLLDGAAVSRRHARVSRRGDDFVIEDLASRRGTLVNGEPVAGPTALDENDAITICHHLLIFHRGVENAVGSRTWSLSLSEGETAQQTVIMSTLDASTSAPGTRVNVAAKLGAVLEIQRSLNRALRVGELVPKVLDSLFRVFPQAARGCVLLEVEGRDELEPVAVKSRDGLDGEVRISHTIVQQALARRQGILSADALSDEQFQSSESISGLGIRSIMCVPLLGQSGEPLGVLQLHTEQGRQAFTTDDLEVLVSIGGAVALATENARFHENQMAQERLLREMQLAREVQQGFLPRRTPAVDGYSFFAQYDSAYSVGGDYYGYIPLPDDRVGVALGDVSGKGMSAAMLMARLSSDVRFALLSSLDAGEALREVNLSLAEAEIEGKFITLLLMVLDPHAHRLQLANAGHVPPLLRRSDGSVETIGEEIAGFPLNVTPDPEYVYRTITVELPPGSVISAFTDGVTEARNPDGEWYGEERVESALSAVSLGGVESIAKAAGDAILEDLWSYGNGCPQRDDVTLVVFGRSSSEAGGAEMGEQS